MQKKITNKLTINWKYFSLEQINSSKGLDWQIWEHPDEYSSSGLCAFWGAEAAHQQGDNNFHSFHVALLKAKHEEKRDIADKTVITKVAKNAGLDMKQFQNDFGNRQLLYKLAKDHTYAAEKLGIFGTPTLVFPDRQTIFLKMSPPPSPKECLPIFYELYNFACHRQMIHEIKRPQVKQERAKR